MEPRTRYTRAIEVGAHGSHVGFTMVFDEDREHFLFDRATAQSLAVRILQVLERSAPPAPPALSISVGEDIKTKEALG